MTTLNADTFGHYLDTIDMIVNWYDCIKSIMIDKKCYELYHIALEQSEQK